MFSIRRIIFIDLVTVSLTPFTYRTDRKISFLVPNGLGISESRLYEVVRLKVPSHAPAQASKLILEKLLRKKLDNFDRMNF